MEVINISEKFFVQTISFDICKVDKYEKRINNGE